jgi:type VI secretion system protein ImpH
VIDELVKDPKGFAYFQALRLLWLANRDRFDSLSDLINQGLLIKSATDLAFPTADLTDVKKLQNGDYDLTVTFMGLAGAASPLPPFYAQEILADVLNEDYGSSLLINLVSLPSYRGHAIAHFHNQLAFRLLEERDPNCWAMINSLLGLANEDMERAAEYGDLAYLNLLATQFRTADGLLAFVSNRFNFPIDELSQCVLRWVSVPADQRLALGGPRDFRALGGAVLGGRARDVRGQFILTVQVADRELFEGLKPGGQQRVSLEKAVDRYLNAPLVYGLKLVFAPGVVPGVKLGHGAALGHWACLSPPESEIVLYSPAAGDRGGSGPVREAGTP